MKCAIPLILTPLLLLLVACSDGSDNYDSAARQLQQRFGNLQAYISETGMQQLLDYQDSGNPVTLVQLMETTDAQTLARYDEQAAALWESIGARERFRSTVFGQMIGERGLNEVRAVEFPSAAVLVNALDTPMFTDLMNLLATASSDHAWVLGEEDNLPFDPSGSYFDPALQGLDDTQARALLAGVAGAGAGNSPGLEPSSDTIVEMLVSDAPGPFWMVNLIDFYAQANFPDGRESDLSGEEANAIYGNAILPSLLRYNSLPELLMPVSITLTNESVDWEQAAIVRYASRDAFLNAFPLNPQSADALQFKAAGVENTLVYASEVPGTMLPAPASGPLYEFRYCEVLLVFAANTGLRADVYNSMPLSDCPQQQWDALDAQQIASNYGALSANLNGIRFWVLDAIEAAIPPGTPVIEDFGGINMRLAASVALAPAVELGGSALYQVNRVSRDTVFHYVAGRQVYELEDAEGIRYRMQSYTTRQDKDLQLVDLQRLGERLQLPPGWSFHVVVLAEDTALLTVDGIAEVVVDDLGNTYQRVP